MPFSCLERQQMVLDTRDRGWAWVVLAAAFILLLISGIPFVVGVYVSEFIIESFIDRPQVALFGSLQIGALYISGIAGLLTRYLSHRSLLFVFCVVGAVGTLASIYVTSASVLYITFGIIPGFSSGVICLQSMVMVNRYFSKRTYFASCVTLSGSAAATVVLPPLFRLIINIYGLKPSLFIVSGIFIQGCVFAMCLKPIHIERIVSVDLREKMTGNKSLIYSKCLIFYNPELYLFLIANIFWSYTISVVFVLLPNLLYEENIHQWQSNIILSTVGAANISGRLLCAYIFNVFNISQVFAHIFGSIIMAFSLILFVMSSKFPLLLCASLMFGCSFGLTCCTQSTVSRAIGGLKQYNLVYSLVYGVCTLGACGGPPFSGMIYNLSRSYKTTFIITSGMTFASAVVMVIASILPKIFRIKSYSKTLEVEQLTVEVPQD